MAQARFSTQLSQQIQPLFFFILKSFFGAHFKCWIGAAQHACLSSFPCKLACAKQLARLAFFSCEDPLSILHAQVCSPFTLWMPIPIADLCKHQPSFRVPTFLTAPLHCHSPWEIRPPTSFVPRRSTGQALHPLARCSFPVQACTYHPARPSHQQPAMPCSS